MIKMRLDMKTLLMQNAGRIRTENGAVTNATTGSNVLNLFALGGAVRGRQINEVVNLVDAAWREDQDLALRTIFYLGDVRGGQGERDFFFNSLRYLADKRPAIARKIVALIPEYSRWDMLFAFIGTPVEKDAFAVMKEQFYLDIKALDTRDASISLLAKWLPSPGTTSQKELAVRIARAFNLELGAYRKARAVLNRKINTVEVFMSANQWNKIDFESVPGKAFMNYQKAFERHGYEKMQKFVEAIKTGEAKVKSNVLYPHEIVYKQLSARGNEVITLQSAWENLPNYVKDGRQGIAVVDTSGSMSGEPLLVAKALGIYLAERLSGPYKDHYITFSQKPIMGELHGSTVAEKFRNMQEINANTNIEAVFDLILNVATSNHLSQEEIPTHLYIFSDMEFDRACGGGNFSWGSSGDGIKLNKTLFEKIKAKYNRYGYDLPTVIFWNLDARQNQSPVEMHETGTALVSGFSPATFKYIMEGKIVTPYDTMLKVLNSPRYALLSEAFN
jgi:hypothetical protein